MKEKIEKILNEWKVRYEISDPHTIEKQYCNIAVRDLEYLLAEAEEQP